MSDKKPENFGVFTPGVGLAEISGCHSLGCKYGCWERKKKRKSRSVGVDPADDDAGFLGL